MPQFSPQDLPRRIELALFNADATRHDLEILCATAREQGLRSVCVNGSRVELAGALGGNRGASGGVDWVSAGRR